MKKPTAIQGYNKTVTDACPSTIVLTEPRGAREHRI